MRVFLNLINVIFQLFTIKLYYQGSQLVGGADSRFIKWLFDEYGPVVRLEAPLGGNIVILSRPEHVQAVFKNEGPYPIRSSLDCIEKYRLQHRQYKQAGPYIM